MNLSKILSENSFLNPLIEKAITDRKEVIRLSRLVSFAGLFIIGVFVISISITLIGTYVANNFYENFDPNTYQTTKTYSILNSFLYKNSYLFIYGGLILGYLIYHRYSKPLSVKLLNFQESEHESISKIMELMYPEYKFETTRYAEQNETFELNKIFGWKGKEHVIYKIYGSLKNETASIKTKIYDIGVTKYAKTPSYLIYIPYLNILYYYFEYTITLIKNIFSGSTPEANLNDFRGLYMIGEFPKKLNGYTLVLPKSIESQLQQWNVNDQERVVMEDPRFTEQFLVYSTDQVEARYTISSAMMERIVAFKEKAKLPIMIAFVGNKIHIAIKNKDGIFSIPTAKKEALEVLQEITEEVEVSLDIVNDFSLSRRIFG